MNTMRERVQRDGRLLDGWVGARSRFDSAFQGTMIFLERAHFHSEDPVESRIEWLELLYFCMASS